MSKSRSYGRGRGWLRLQMNPPISPNSAPIRTGEVLGLLKEESEFSDLSEYKDIINALKELNVSDDGIKFNQKIKYILETWKRDCQNSEEVEKSFDAIYQRCLNDADLASKLVIMISSRSFISQEVHDQNIRLIFLRKLQNDFEGCKIRQWKNPVAFRNMVRMLGEFHNKARLANGQPFTFMFRPLLSYFEILLKSAHALDLEVFTCQIYLNGSALETEFPDKINELFNKVRALLVSDKKISKDGKLWLLLSLEIAGNKFGILPLEVFKFYEYQIGGSAMAIFQGATNPLSVQTLEDNKTLENCQSSVNVLQLSTKAGSSTISEPNYPVLVNNSDVYPFTSTSGLVSDTSSQNSNSNSKEATQNSGTFGRPILGAGARLSKNTSNEIGSNNWRKRDNSSGWWSKSSGLAWRNRGTEKNTRKNKGWEHDDRFENDYS